MRSKKVLQLFPNISKYWKCLQNQMAGETSGSCLEQLVESFLFISNLHQFYRFTVHMDTAYVGRYSMKQRLLDPDVALENFNCYCSMFKQERREAAK